VHGSLLVSSVVLITVVTGIAALYPSMRASRLVAEVRLHPTFSDHAVLQRGMSVPV